MNNKLIIIALAALSFGACKNDIQPSTPHRGNADFTKYVAIGNSLTAGYADGTLYLSGQENSFPAMLATQFKAVGGGEFRQPLLLDDKGWPSMKTVMGYKENCVTGDIELSPVTLDGTPDDNNALNIGRDAMYNNMGIPGVRCIDFGLPGYAAFNPYANRMLTDAQKVQTLAEVMKATAPTFFSLWLGNNDVLGYAGNGGVVYTSGIYTNAITPVITFKYIYDALIDSMTKDGAKGILVTIPDVASTPAFNTIPYNGLVLERQGQADSLNAVYGPLGINFKVGANPFIIADSMATYGFRQIEEGELILLSASNNIQCAGWGSITPIPTEYTLDVDELENIRTATASFNSIIKDNATRKGLALFDANAYLKTVQSGMVWNGVKFGPSFVTGGIFSLDGIHLTQRGYAFVANEMIKTINAKYGSTIALVDVNDYYGILFP